MKKNLTFKLGLFCAALVLVATCFVTNAWAKYTKTVSATDSARVALFSINAKVGNANFKSDSAKAIDIFGTALDHIKKDGEGNNVNGDKLIAPGSKGQFQIVLENNSEVDVLYSLRAEVENVGVDSVQIPIYWTVDGTEYTTLNEALQVASNNRKILVDGADQAITVNWEWKFDNSVDGNDTILGEDGEAEYVVTIYCTATQVLPQ